MGALLCLWIEIWLIQSESIIRPLAQTIITDFTRDTQNALQIPKMLLFSHATSNPLCVKSPMREWTFTREYFEDSYRELEVVTAVQETIYQNDCARFIFLVQSTHYVDALKRISLRMDASAEVYLVAAPLTIRHLFESATWTNTTKYFVVSTGDVAISSLHHLEKACGNALAALDLLVVSRRDNDTNAEGLTDCLNYWNEHGSFDVYIGNVTLLQEAALRSLVFSPSYCGVENISAFVLARNGVFNLCPYIDVVHYHAFRKQQSWRPRINHPGNSITPSDVSSVCDVKVLVENKRKGA